MSWRIITDPDGLPVPEECEAGEHATELEAWASVLMRAEAELDRASREVATSEKVRMAAREAEDRAWGAVRRASWECAWRAARGDG